ncbi:acetate kinase [Azorhizobium oxalatiphilum]|uniref:Acetate kinase n=1 Tax=Azorhizobium oxalatiphilum TaxID=980631 RepID=A0A917BYE6_9HYPH|nr:acetate/propionate family kinase [Azorhizobium oxalatiphilum]GGF60997.1 acetate kinase [Azorhizobium oxalatiphilum]
MSRHILLTFNPGSSTIKLGLFDATPEAVKRIGKGVIDLRHKPLVLNIVEGRSTAEIPLKAHVTEDLHEVIEETLDWLAHHFEVSELTAVGHRVVHGGDTFSGPVRITPEVEKAIAGFVPLAPLHQPHSVRLINAIARLRPSLPQVASFDTAFHRTQPDLVRRFALPRHLFDAGIKRYGFHGLSYKYIASALGRVAPDVAGGRIVAAHLGSGASLCALKDGQSADTSMGFSTIDGIPMATRCGALDPGVLLHLQTQAGMPLSAVEDLVYHRSGLLGLSGISADSRDLLASEAPEAREAIAIFAFRIAREMAALATSIGGLDALVFTAGIGEHQPRVRAEACAHLHWLGVKLDDAANGANAARISAPDSRVGVFVIPTDEEQVIADEAFGVLHMGDVYA